MAATLTRKEAATYLTSIGVPVSPGLLADKACNKNAGKGPPYTVFGWKTVRYDKVDLDAWAKTVTRRVE